MNKNVKVISKNDDKFIVGRTMLDSGEIGTIIIFNANTENEVDIVFGCKDSLRLLNLIARAMQVTTNDLNDMYCAFEKRYNPYPVQMSREEAFRRALNDELIEDSVYQLARRYYGNLWDYVGD